jgi:hypothetical protein
VATTVVVRKLTDGTEADFILDQLERITGLHGERFDGGRRLDLTDSKDLVIAMASIRGQLDAISDTWPIHLGLELDAE